MRPWLPATAVLLAGVAALTAGTVERTLQLVLVGLALTALANGYLLGRTDTPPRALAATVAAAFGVVLGFAVPGLGHVLAGAVALVAGAVVVSSFADDTTTAA